MVNRRMKRCSTSFIIREIQIKTTLRYHLTPVRMAKINSTRNTRFWGGCGERGTRLRCWWECKLVQPLWKTAWRFFKKLKRATLWSINCTTGYLSQRSWCSETPGHLHPNIHGSHGHNNQTVKGATMSVDRWMDKEDVVYIYNRIWLNHQKRWIPTICFYVGGTGGY